MWMGILFVLYAAIVVGTFWIDNLEAYKQWCEGWRSADLEFTHKFLWVLLGLPMTYVFTVHLKNWQVVADREPRYFEEQIIVGESDVRSRTREEIVGGVVNATAASSTPTAG